MCTDDRYIDEEGKGMARRMIAVEGKSVVSEWSKLSARRLARQGRARSIQFPIQHSPNSDTSLPTRGSHNPSPWHPKVRQGCSPQRTKQDESVWKKAHKKPSIAHILFVSLSSSSARVTAEAEEPNPGLIPAISLSRRPSNLIGYPTPSHEFIPYIIGPAAEPPDKHTLRITPYRRYRSDASRLRRGLHGLAEKRMRIRSVKRPGRRLPCLPTTYSANSCHTLRKYPPTCVHVISADESERTLA